MFGDAFQWHFPTPPQGDSLTVIVDLLRPVSKPGHVTLRSANHADPPHINLNFFASDLDLVAMREGVRFVDDILMNGDGMKDIIGEDYPWAMPRLSDEAMNRAILERSQTGFRKCSFPGRQKRALSHSRHALTSDRSMWDMSSFRGN